MNFFVLLLNQYGPYIYGHSVDVLTEKQIVGVRSLNLAPLLNVKRAWNLKIYAL